MELWWLHGDVGDNADGSFQGLRRWSGHIGLDELLRTGRYPAVDAALLRSLGVRRFSDICAEFARQFRQQSPSRDAHVCGGARFRLSGGAVSRTLASAETARC